MAKASVIGSGSWGTTLAMVLNENGHDVTCYTIEQSTIDDIDEKQENSRYLPGVKIPPEITFTLSLEEAVSGADIIVNAVPAQVTRKVVPEVIKYAGNDQALWVTVSKGIENGTYKRISEVIHEAGAVENDRIVVLSGPSHAEEVSRKIPTAIVSASSNMQAAETIQKAFMNAYLRIYANDDIIGVELGGALKNIIALAAGICDGAEFGDNTKAALMTRGLVEMNRLGVKLGARSSTFAGLSGMGDLIVTCMSQHSRNRYVGEQIGKGRTLQQVLDEMVMVAEGVTTTKAAYELARKHGVEMPITEKVYEVLFEDSSARKAVASLMQRQAKSETWG